MMPFGGPQPQGKAKRVRGEETSYLDGYTVHVPVPCTVRTSKGETKTPPFAVTTSHAQQNPVLSRAYRLVVARLKTQVRNPGFQLIDDDDG